MRFLLDENLPRSVAELIRDLGHDVLVVTVVAPGRARSRRLL